MEYANITERICPMCGKNFIPAAYHGWTFTNKKYIEIPVCSYHCMRQAERKGKDHSVKKLCVRRV